MPNAACARYDRRPVAMPDTDAQSNQHSAQPSVVIAGFGLVTPLGDGAWPTFRALLDGRTLADRTAALPPDVAPVDLVRALGCVGAVQHSRADPAVLLAERAAREAATMAGVEPSGLGLWLGTSKGAVARLSDTLGNGRPIDNEAAANVALGPHAYMADRLQQRLHTRAVSHHVAACSSGLVALDAARRALIRACTAAGGSPERGSTGLGNASESAAIAGSGLPPAAMEASDGLEACPSGPYALVVSADAAITPAFVHSYRRLGVLGELTTAHYRQRPLDERRRGFMLSEVGVAVLLKRIDPGEPMPAGAVELADTATGCEPYDIVRSPSDMRGLAGLWRRISAGRSIDLIHPHAPGTLDHDPAELDVLLQTPSPAESQVADDVYAVKGAIGHGLGASGLASLVVSAMCLQAGRRPPMPWLSEPMKLPGGRRLETDPKARACARTGSQAVLAAGFGGHLAAAVLLGHSRRPPLA